MKLRDLALGFRARWQSTSLRAQALIVAWLLFVLLVSLRIHGSSIGLAVQVLFPEGATQHFVAGRIADELPKNTAKMIRPALMAENRPVRSDEWATDTPWALSQFEHHPRFPVVNTNIGLGMNMLLDPYVPVWHVSAVARPATWGYLLLGRQAGLSWSWWFQVFFCFTAALLLFDIILRDTRLAIFGAFWVSSSAFVIFWSLWPAYIIAFVAMACVAAYWILTKESLRVRLASAVLLAVCACGFMQRMYPPWQVPLAQVFGVILVALVIRDRTLIRRPLLGTLGPLGLCLAITAVVMGTFLWASRDALHALANTTYPGQRRMVGADLPLAQLFSGFYAFFTAFDPPRALLRNESHASGFLLFFPALALALALSRQARRRMDVVGWAALAICLFQTVYCFIGFPRWLSTATLLAWSQGVRAQIGIGIASILVSLYFLRPNPSESQARLDRYAPYLATVLFAAFLVFEGAGLQEASRLFMGNALIPGWVWIVSLGWSVVAFFLVAGRSKPFMVAVIVSLVIPGWFFNPLCRGFTSFTDIPVGRAIATLVARDREEGKHSAWLSLGWNGSYEFGALLSAVGARSLSGTFLYPQQGIWRNLDPSGEFDHMHNRFAIVSFYQTPIDGTEISMKAPQDTQVQVYASPRNAAFRELGVRYIVTQGDDGFVSEPEFRLVMRSSKPRLAIWEATP